MADITKCPGEGCGLKEVCYRYTAPENEYWQAYLLETPTDNPCPYFWQTDDPCPYFLQGDIWEDANDG